MAAPADALRRRRHRAGGLSGPDRHVQHARWSRRGPPAPRLARRRPRRRRPDAAAARAVATPDSITWADQEREARDPLSSSGRRRGRSWSSYDGDDVRRLAAAGITSALAVPAQGIIRGQSALVNVTAPPDPAETSALADLSARLRRRASRRSRSTWSSLPAGSGGGGGGGYPGALLGVSRSRGSRSRRAVAEGRARLCRTPQGRAAVGGFEPALDALAPALERKMPVAFDASEEREILRALAFAKEFNLDPIIVGGAEAANVIDELKAAKARGDRVGELPGGRRWRRRGRGGGGRGGGEPTRRSRITRMRQNAAKVPAALEKAGIPFAFTVGGLQNPAEFVRSVARAVQGRRTGGGRGAEGADDRTPRSSPAPAIASARSRRARSPTSSSPKAICSTAPRIRHVFVAGWPVDIEAAAQAPAGRGRGAH